MWGAMELFEKGKELERKYVKGMRPTPIDPGFTAAHLSALIEACAVEGSRSVKGLLTQDQLIPGLGNALAQDIMFKARLHPRRPVAGLSRTQVKNLHQAIVGTVAEAMKPTCRGTPDRTGASWTVQRRGTRAQRAERKSRRWRTWEAPASTARHARKHRETHLPNVVEDRWPAERHMRST
jgi:formamidopyrimidine-DNA glycosylase